MIHEFSGLFRVSHGSNIDSNLTRIADSKYRLSRDDMAISFRAVSDKIPSQLKKFRNNFNALLN